MRSLAALLLALVVLAGACVREKEREKTAPLPATSTRATKPAPIDDHDLTGRKRAAPRPTMGALEAEPASPHRQPKDSRRRTDERLK